MRNKIKSLLQNSLLICIISLLLVQCTEKNPVAAPGLTIDETLAANADLSLLKTALAQAKLETFTKGPGPFTLFAPTNAALNAAGITTATLPTIDSVTLTTFLLNHMQNLKRTSFEIPDGPNAPMASMAGYSNYGYKDKAANKAFVNGATITSKDVACSNGTIHIIDKPLIVPSFTIISYITANPNYSLMLQAITKTATTSTFSPSATVPATVFLLDNATMTANGYDAVTIAALTGTPLTTLTNILKYHVISSRNFTVAMKTGTLKTVFGTNVNITAGTAVTVKGISNATAFTLSNTDIPASNGVLHTVSGMLKP